MVDTLVMECDDFRLHMIELIDAGIEKQYADIVREWEAEILWGIER